MIKKFIAIAASAALLLTSFVPAAMAEGSDLPVTGSDKPSDYTKVLFLEDYEGDTTPNKTTLEWKPNAQISISSDASGTVSTKEQGSFAVVQQPTQPNDSYFRMKYGADTAPVQATGVTVADLSRVQVSLDVCPMTDFQFPLRFYDKFSGSSTKGETLIVINKGGYLTFANTDVTYDCSLGQWLAIDVFLDFDADVYSVYVNGNEAVSGAALKILTECVESVGVVPSSINEGDTYCIYMDNFRIAVPGKFEVVSTTPSEGAIGVDVAGSVQFELSDAPVNLDESMVTVTGGTSELVYTVTQADGIISIDFDGGLEYSTQYTVTLSGDIADAAGRTLGEAAVVSFTTASAPSTAADYDTVIYTNDFESAPVGANLSESEINYRPENAAYEIVQEGDNKYYKFSPSDTSKRANSGNLETGYFLPATLADKPIRKVKIDLDIAVDVKDGGPATISTYYRGRVASGALNARYNFVEFTADKYYAATDKLLKQSYTAGDWIHFTIYANYESNLMSVYTDDGFA
ncbi:MAG: Ig-like domain-containing protein, partial [Clostridia bacterium]|nr:Ig-like domain-containing protein [Clostridia bacterium]